MNTHTNHKTLEIKTRNLGKKYGSNRLFKDLNLEFTQPGNYAITGFNGSGKSTLLLCLAGYITPNEGQVTWTFQNNDQNLKNIHTLFSFCSPALNLFEELTLLEHVTYHQKFVSTFNFTACMQKLELYGLAKAKNKPIQSFSSGMKQRLKLLMALENDVPVLFLDEPCSNLDEEGITLFKQQIIEKSARKIVVIATNQPDIEFPLTGKTIHIQSHV